MVNAKPGKGAENQKDAKVENYVARFMSRLLFRSMRELEYRQADYLLKPVSE